MDTSAPNPADLFSQQIWCWGQDIARPEGNWLTHIGFERIAPPEDRSEAPSVYRLHPKPGRTLLLRGFGIWFSDTALGGIFLPRYAFEPRFCPAPHLDLPGLPWRLEDLPEFDRPTQDQQPASDALLAAFCCWVAEYETDLLNQLGVGYRDQSLAPWDDGSRAIIPPQTIPRHWQALATSLREPYASGVVA